MTATTEGLDQVVATGMLEGVAQGLAASTDS
jgi:hypothetical protein